MFVFKQRVSAELSGSQDAAPLAEHTNSPLIGSGFSVRGIYGALITGGLGTQ